MVISIEELSDKHYSNLASTHVQEICSPLAELEIIHFMHGRFFKTGSGFCLTNHWQSYYNHCKKQYIISPPISKKIIGKKFFYFPTFNLDVNYNPAAYDWQNQFNIGQPIYFIEHSADSFDLFVFSSMANNLNAINIYLNNIDVLEKFIAYFKNKAYKLIADSYQNQVWLPGAMTVNMVETQKIFEHEKFKKKMLAQLEIKRYMIPGKIALTRREVETIKQLVEGCTLKEAARNLDISPRTVETHLNNVKSKLSLRKKSDIIKLLSDFDLLS